jgi:hypothetical protein
VYQNPLKLPAAMCFPYNGRKSFFRVSSNICFWNIWSGIGRGEIAAAR